MNKIEFINELERRLTGLPEDDKKERLAFYNEMISDRVDEGKTEEEAVNDLGGIDKVVSDIASDTPLISLVKEKVKPKHQLRGWEIAMLIVGFPLWFPLLIVFILLCLLGYLLIWLGVLITYTIEVCLASIGVWGLVLFFGALGGGLFSMTYLGMALACLGGAFLFIFACIGITKATITLSKITIRKIKSSFLKGETK